MNSGVPTGALGQGTQEDQLVSQQVVPVASTWNGGCWEPSSGVIDP
jgi:hypothetical protein